MKISGSWTFRPCSGVNLFQKGMLIANLRQIAINDFLKMNLLSIKNINFPTKPF